MQFYVGMHNPHHAHHVDRAFISINRLRGRISSFPANAWIMDSGAFTEISTHGRYRDDTDVYAHRIARWASAGNNLEAAVCQDFMCEPFILQKTGGTIEQHQRWTIERFDDLMMDVRMLGCRLPLIPVLQGWTPEDYVAHLHQYAGRLSEGMRVGVGSVCKRNARPQSVFDILHAIKAERPDLRLHGFGLKITALKNDAIRELLYSADSMAWSFAARRQGRDANGWAEARAFEETIQGLETT